MNGILSFLMPQLEQYGCQPPGPWLVVSDKLRGSHSPQSLPWGLPPPTGVSLHAIFPQDSLEFPFLGREKKIRLKSNSGPCCQGCSYMLENSICGEWNSLSFPLAAMPRDCKPTKTVVLKQCQRQSPTEGKRQRAQSAYQ